MSARRFVFGFAAFSALAAPAVAQRDATALRQQSLAASCAACHGTAGRPPADASMPPLAGMPAAVLIARMRAYKSEPRAATVMQQLARGYSEAQIEALGAFFALQPR